MGKNNLQITLNRNKDPFEEASLDKIYLKICLISEEPGSGKTFVPIYNLCKEKEEKELKKDMKGCIIDMENGCSMYGNRFHFNIIQTSSSKKVFDTIEWLHYGDHDYDWVMIDSITNLWEDCLHRWSNKLLLDTPLSSSGNHGDFYILQPGDWKCVKEEFKFYMRRLHDLKMHVFTTCRMKTLYSDVGFMKKQGKTYDADKCFPYHPDVIINLEKIGDQFYYETIKERTIEEKPRLSNMQSDITNKKFILDAYKDILQNKGNKTRKGQMITPSQKERIIKLCREKGIKDSLFTKTISESKEYKVNSIDDLRFEAAEQIIFNLNKGK